MRQAGQLLYRLTFQGQHPYTGCFYSGYMPLSLTLFGRIMLKHEKPDA